MLTHKKGWILRLQKNREGVGLPLACSFLLSYIRKSIKSNCIWVTKVAFHLQNWHLGYKSGVSFTNIQLSITNIAFQFTKWHLAFQLSFSIFKGVLYIYYSQSFCYIYCLKCLKHCNKCYSIKAMGNRRWAIGYLHGFEALESRREVNNERGCFNNRQQAGISEQGL